MNDLHEKALDLFEVTSSNVDEILYTVMFSACAALSNPRAVQCGTKLLDQTVVVGCALNMLIQLGDVDYAERLFSQMQQPTTYTYGLMMNGYNFNDQPRQCLKVFDKLQEQGIAINEAIACSLIGTCSQIGILSICRYTVNRIPLDIRNRSQLKNALMDMWVCKQALFQCSMFIIECISFSIG
jgi:pentatricopeptide repeat protein